MNNMVVLQFSGIPLPLIGMAAYGLVAALGLQLASNKLLFGINKSTAQAVLLGATASMAAASAYFLYILTTRFSDSSCSYCLLSAFLSFTLFFVTLKVRSVNLLSMCLYLFPVLLLNWYFLFWNLNNRTLDYKRCLKNWVYNFLLLA